MPETAFIVTVDTEGDNLWERPTRIETRNAAFLPRFQSLCERFGFKPVYLTNYEMAMSDAFVEFARDVAERGAGEIGMHLHAWNSPPLTPLTDDDYLHQPYLTEFPEQVMRRKIKRLTQLLEDRIGRRMLSHRAGRWGFDGRYAALLRAEGYRVDCSVTPGLSWCGNPGAPQGKGGADYRYFPAGAYHFDPPRIDQPAGAAKEGSLLEVPMTVVAGGTYRRAPWLYRIPVLRRAANVLAPGLSWLCPVQPTIRAPLLRHLQLMLQVARAARAQAPLHLQFMIHSSELMPGGGPSFPGETEIERLYEHLELLFEDVSKWCRGVTLEEFYLRRTPVGGTASVAPCAPRGAAAAPHPTSA